MVKQAPAGARPRPKPVSLPQVARFIVEDTPISGRMGVDIPIRALASRRSAC